MVVLKGVMLDTFHFERILELGKDSGGLERTDFQ